MAGVLKSGKQDSSHRMCQTKTHQGQDRKTMGNAVILILGVVHRKCKGMAFLLTDVTEQLLIEASVKSLVMFATAVLIRGNGASVIAMGKGQAANVFVANLKSSRHQLDKPHFVYIVFFWDIDSSDGLSGQMVKPHFQGDIVKLSINVIEERVVRRRFVVGETEAARFQSGMLILGAPGIMVLLWGHKCVDGAQHGYGGRPTKL